MSLNALCDVDNYPITRKVYDFHSSSKNTIAFPSSCKRSASKAAQPLQDPYMVKRISDYLVSLDKPWAYRMNAIWCLGVIAGCRASAMVRHGKDGRIDPDDDYTPMYIRDVLSTPTKFKERIVLHERKTGKESSILLVPFVKEAIALYLKKCRPGFKLSEPLFNGREAPYPAIVCAKNTVCTLIEESKSLTDSSLRFVEPESVNKIRYGETYVRIGEKDRSYKQGFSKIYLGEVQAILESDFKRKPDLSIVFFTIVSRIRPRKSGDDPKERPEACSISVRILCEFTGLSELRVSKAVRELKKLGVLCALTPTFPSRKDGNYVSLNTVYARGGHEDELNAKVKLLIHGKKTDLDF